MLQFAGKITSSTIKEVKKTQDHIVLTKFVFTASPGLFAEYDKELEQVALYTRCWSSLTTGEQDGEWHLNIKKDGEVLSEIKQVNISNIQLKYKENEVICGLTVKHKLSNGQKALETSISTEVQVELEQIKEEAKV